MLSVSQVKFWCMTFALCAVGALTGCSGRLIPSAGPQTISLHTQGRLRGGQQPVNGATIQLYDITAAGGGASAAVPLIGSSVTSDAGGGFNITGDYTCPSASDQVYLSATGGDAGSGTNADLVMMTALGNCGDLTAATFISVNEVTTVATIWAYFNGFDASQTNGANLVLVQGGEYQNFLTLVDPTSGVALTTNGANVQLQLNALGNSLSSCINSATDSNGDSVACDNLITVAGNVGSPYKDSAEAVFAIASNASSNTTGVFNYAPPSPPFQPTLTSAPSAWNLGI